MATAAQKKSALTKLAKTKAAKSGAGTKKAWSAEAHPRYPKGHPRGGKFMNKADTASFKATGAVPGMPKAAAVSAKPAATKPPKAAKAPKVAATKPPKATTTKTPKTPKSTSTTSTKAAKSKTATEISTPPTKATSASTKKKGIDAELDKILGEWDAEPEDPTPAKAKTKPKAEPKTESKPVAPSASTPPPKAESPLKDKQKFQDAITATYQEIAEKKKNDLVAIPELRKAIGRRLSNDEFNTMMNDLQGDDVFQLIGGEYAGDHRDLQNGGEVTTRLNGKRFYMKAVETKEHDAVKKRIQGKTAKDLLGDEPEEKISKSATGETQNKKYNLARDIKDSKQLMEYAEEYVSSGEKNSSAGGVEQRIAEAHKELKGGKFQYKTPKEQSDLFALMGNAGAFSNNSTNDATLAAKQVSELYKTLDGDQRRVLAQFMQNTNQLSNVESRSPDTQHIHKELLQLANESQQQKPQAKAKQAEAQSEIDDLLDNILGEQKPAESKTSSDDDDWLKDFDTPTPAKQTPTQTKSSPSILAAPGSRQTDPLPPPKVFNKPNIGSHKDIDADLDYEEKLESIAKLTGKSVEDAEKMYDAVQAFTTEDYSPMRGLERGRVKPGDSKYQQIKAQVDTVNQFMDSMPTYKGTVYRGLSMPDAAKQQEFLGNAKPGTEMMIDAMSSFSSNLDIANKFAKGENDMAEDWAKNGNPIVMSVAANKSGVSIRGISEFSEEDEVLVPRSAKYKILGTRVENGITYIDLEDIS